MARTGRAAGANPDAPLEDGEFAGLMAGLGPFERHPAIAAGVSGGADSLALCLLLAAWLEPRGGSLLGLTVDHGLRPESAAEAGAVGRLLADRGIAHETVAWRDAKPASGLQAAAREVRYRLLAERCRAAGILHLALAQHRDDQAETVLLRLAKGSGVAGLAGMAAIQEQADLRLLRPLLAIPKRRLMATCRARGVTWIEDPSNRNPGFARGRLRAAEAALAAEGLTAASLAETALRAGRTRAVLEAATAEALARWVQIHPEGYALLDATALAETAEEIGRLCLARLLVTIGGGPYPPRRERLDRLYRELRQAPATGRTLGGCRLLPLRRAGDAGWLVVREAAAAAERLILGPESPDLWWDRRFRVRASGAFSGRLVVARLGDPARADVAEMLRPLRAVRPHLPAAALPALPAFWSESGRLLAVPALGPVGPDSPEVVVGFQPATPLAGPLFAPAVVSSGVPLIYSVDVGNGSKTSDPLETGERTSCRPRDGD